MTRLLDERLTYHQHGEVLSLAGLLALLVLAVIAFNLTRIVGALAAPDLAKATTATLRRKLMQLPCRVATSARRVTIHLPTGWP